ncbi:MAG: hypothetical protein J0I14_10690 [Propionibacteriaceae bacterium]|jgi:hypothetical protein|nr:hypothetical protein [Propionibacteriaceae bacterium]
MTQDRVVTAADQLLFDALEHATGDVLLVSPYLSYRVCERLAHLASAAPVAWTLVTCRNAAAVNTGHLNVPGLRRLLGSGVNLEHVDQLHAKAYLAGDGFGLIGSANLTERGLGSAAQRNRELGVQLSPAEIADTRAIVLGWDRTPLTSADLDQLEEEARQLSKPPRTRKATTKPTVSTVDRLIADARDGRELWVKAEYGASDPQHYQGPSRFASPSPKRRPSFKPGDLAIIYSQGIHACYAVVEVTDEPTYDPEFLHSEGASAEDSARWPWISHTIPRLVPESVVEVKPEEIGVSTRALQNGHVRIDLAGFTAAVRALEDASGGAETD